MEYLANSILVVDDEPSICKWVAAFLAQEGYNPVTCDNSVAALDLFTRNKFCLTFIDINMPGMNGLNLASKLKKIHPEIEIIFMTGFGTFEHAIQAIKIGAYDFLRKPFSTYEIKLCLQRFQERQELLEKVKLAEQRYFHLVQDVPSIIMVVRRDFSLEFINHACLAMLGYPPEDAMENPHWFSDRLHPSDLQRVKKIFDTAFQASGTRFSIECRLISKEGHSIHGIIKSISPAVINKGMPVDHLKAIFVDISDRIYLEKAKVQNEKLNLLGAISEEIAHDIRNPLVSIGGFASRLQKKCPQLPEGDIILRESKKLDQMLKKIINYLKPIKFSYQEYSINRIVTDGVSRLAPENSVLGIDCKLNLDLNLPDIKIDKDILTRIFIDLLLIIARDTEKGSSLKIKTFSTDENLHIEIKNDHPKAKAKGPGQFIIPFHESGQDTSMPLSFRLLKNMQGLLSYSQEGREMISTISLPKKAPSFLDPDGFVAPW